MQLQRQNVERIIYNHCYLKLPQSLVWSDVFKAELQTWEKPDLTKPN